MRANIRRAARPCGAWGRRRAGTGAGRPEGVKFSVSFDAPPAMNAPPQRELPAATLDAARALDQIAAQALRLGLERQWLHAVELGFAHPRTGLPLTVRSPYPPDLAHALEILREGGR